MSHPVDELSKVFLEPQSWWNLTLTRQNEIEISSLWDRTVHWLDSFFREEHKIRLAHRVKHLIGEMEGSSHPEQQIALEKIARLAHSKNSWLYGFLPELKDSARVEIKGEKELSSEIQPYEEGGRYYNYPGEKIWSRFLQTLYLLFPGALSRPSEEALSTWHQTPWQAEARSIDPKITWLGHAALLIQGQKINLLFDPTFAFVGPCFFRHTPPPIPFEKLPLIDVVGISHNHGDHFDRERLEKLGPIQPFAFVPHRLDEWFLEKGFENVRGVKWWHQTTLEKEGLEIKLTAIPAIHGSQTTVSDLNRTLWMGFLIEMNGTKIYFAGDTAYDKKILKEIKRHFGPIDVACLPIAPEGEREVHLDHQQSLDAFEVLGAKWMIPVHHGAYRMGTEKIEDPLNLFLKVAGERNLLDRILDLKLGETCNVHHLMDQEIVS